MARHVALLKGVNVGAHKQVAMADLRTLLGELGLADVRTHLRSGNVVFSSPGRDAGALEPVIEEAIAEQLGMSVAVLVRSAEAFHRVVAGNPLTGVATDGAKLMAWFLSAAPVPEDLAEHDPRGLDPGHVALGNRVIYQWCPDGVLAAPPVSALVERRLGVTVTGRNWNTVTKLAELLGG